MAAMDTNTAPKPLQIFKPGRHTAMNGSALDFSESDLAASAAAYDPAKHEAPIVVGHPKTDGPAYGWVKQLNFAEGALEACPDQVDPAFAELVAKGAYKKISASFYTPDSLQNPVPGVYYLRHVGFLGAQAPAVKGLRSPEFNDSQEGVIEFGDWSDLQNASLWRRFRDWLIGFRGLEEADKVIPDYAVASLEESARQEPADAPLPSFSEQPHQENQVDPAQKAALEAENAQLKQRLAESEARDKAAREAQAAAQANARHTDHASFAEGLIKDGKLLPAQKDFIVAFMDQVASAGGVVEFGEGDAKQSKPGIQGIKEFLSAQPKQVDFGEVAGGKTDPGTASFAAPAGFAVDAEGLELHTKVQEYARANNVTYDQALAVVAQL